MIDEVGFAYGLLELLPYEGSYSCLELLLFDFKMEGLFTTKTFLSTKTHNIHSPDIACSLQENFNAPFPTKTYNWTIRVCSGWYY